MNDKRITNRIEDFSNALDKFGPEDLSAVYKLVKVWGKTQQLKAASKFSFGDKVWFHGRHGIDVHGTVIDVTAKRVKVKAGLVTWRVAPTLVRKEKN